MVNQLNLILIFVFVGVSLGHFQEDTYMAVLSDSIASGIYFQPPLDTVDDVRVGVSDALMCEEVLLHLVSESLVFRNNLLSMDDH